MLIGGRFLKYLCVRDMKSGLKFFNATKDFIFECAKNLGPTDNLNVAIISLQSIFNAYQATYDKKIPEVEEYLLKVMNELI